MSIRVIESGILDTIQDRGRYGYGASGINAGGAMDIIAADVANALVGNAENEAVIEFHFPSGIIEFSRSALISITGADFSPCIDDEPVPLNTPVIVRANSTVSFKKLKHGARCYLAVQGGFAIEPWLGSYSTNLKAKAGGLHGRKLQKDDKITLRSSLVNESNTHALPWHADIASFYNTDHTVRFIKGNEYDLLTDCSETIVQGNTFSISTQSDRMGYHLNGSPLKLKEPKQMISSAVTRGTMQLLPNGQLIILMADHQTTGGYPRLGHVSAADFPTLAQLQPNTAIRFKSISVDEAENLLLQQQHHLHQIKSACSFRLKDLSLVN